MCPTLNDRYFRDLIRDNIRDNPTNRPKVRDVMMSSLKQGRDNDDLSDEGDW
jgi:hypothetical protein